MPSPVFSKTKARTRRSTVATVTVPVPAPPSVAAAATADLSPGSRKRTGNSLFHNTLAGLADCFFFFSYDSCATNFKLISFVPLSSSAIGPDLPEKKFKFDINPLPVEFGACESQPDLLLPEKEENHSFPPQSNDSVERLAECSFDENQGHDFMWDTKTTTLSLQPLIDAGSERMERSPSQLQEGTPIVASFQETQMVPSQIQEDFNFEKVRSRLVGSEQTLLSTPKKEDRQNLSNPTIELATPSTATKSPSSRASSPGSTPANVQTQMALTQPGSPTFNLEALLAKVKQPPQLAPQAPYMEIAYFRQHPPSGPSVMGSQSPAPGQVSPPLKNEQGSTKMATTTTKTALAFPAFAISSRPTGLSPRRHHPTTSPSSFLAKLSPQSPEFSPPYLAKPVLGPTPSKKDSRFTPPSFVSPKSKKGELLFFCFLFCVYFVLSDGLHLPRTSFLGTRCSTKVGNKGAEISGAPPLQISFYRSCVFVSVALFHLPPFFTTILFSFFSSTREVPPAFSPGASAGFVTFIWKAGCGHWQFCACVRHPGLDSAGNFLLEGHLLASGPGVDT